jgi:hypothetical protein
VNQTVATLATTSATIATVPIQKPSNPQPELPLEVVGVGCCVDEGDGVTMNVGAVVKEGVGVVVGVLM